MVCDAVKTNLLEPSRGISGLRPYCVATLDGSFFGDTMKKIPLNNNKGSALVSDDDFALVSQHKWSLLKCKRTSYATTCMKIDGTWRTVLMHRFILNVKKEQEVDHRNSIGLDNQRHNIRPCTRRQNHQNRRKRLNCSSKWKGVTWDRCGSRWRVSINSKPGKNKFIGYYHDERAAAKAYNEVAVEVFGEFARTNVV